MWSISNLYNKLLIHITLSFTVPPEVFLKMFYLLRICDFKLLVNIKFPSVFITLEVKQYTLFQNIFLKKLDKKGKSLWIYYTF